MQKGSIQIYIIPQAAADAGAKWRINTDQPNFWRNSSTIANDLPYGEYTIQFLNIDNWYTPSDMHILLNTSLYKISSDPYVSTTPTPNPVVSIPILTTIGPSGESVLNLINMDAASISKDGKLIATAWHDGQINLWNIIEEKITRQFQVDSIPGLFAKSIAISDDNHFILLGHGTMIQNEWRLMCTIWDVDSAQIINTLDCGQGGQYLVVDISFDNLKILTGGSSKLLNLWDKNTVSLISSFFNNKDFFYSVCFSPDGNKYAASIGDTVYVWNTSTGQLLNTIVSPSIVWSIEFSKNNQSLLIGPYSRGFLWNLTGNYEEAEFGGHESYLSSVAISDDGKKIAFGTQSGQIHVWDLESRTRIVTFNGTIDKYILNLRFISEGAGIISVSQDHTARIWTIPTPTPTSTPHPTPTPTPTNTLAPTFTDTPLPENTFTPTSKPTPIKFADISIDRLYIVSFCCGKPFFMERCKFVSRIFGGSYLGSAFSISWRFSAA